MKSQQWNVKKHRNSNWPLTSFIRPKNFGESAFESPWSTLWIFATYEHFTNTYEHLWKFFALSWLKKKIHKITFYWMHNCSQMVVDARKVLVSVRKMQECKIQIKSLSHNIKTHRQQNFTGQVLMHHLLQSTKYLSKWIEEKNK